MFVANPANTSESLVPLSGGGFGGYWPAKIWNTFAQAKFANLPQETFQNATFTGAAWNQVGKIAPSQITCYMADGKKHKLPVKTCPTPAPMGSCLFDQSNGTFDNCSQSTNNASPSGSSTCQPGDPTCTSTTPSPGSTCQNPADPACLGNGLSGNGQSTPSASGTQSGLAVGGLGALPGAGSALWAMASRRRRRRRAGAAK